MPDYIGPALRGLSQTLQTGLADMGKSRLQEAELALKGAEIGHKIRLEQQEAPKRALELLTARKRAMEEIDKDKPFNVSGFVENDLVPVQLTGGQVSPRLKTNVKMFGAQIVPKLGKAFGEDTEYDPVNKLWYHKSTNTPVTKREVEERQQALSGLIMMHTDGGKFLEMLAEEGSPAAIQTMQGRQADPLAYQKQVLDIKRQVYEQLASQNLGEKALKPALDRLLKEEERYEKLLLEQRTEERALAREDRGEQREEDRFQRGRQWDVTKMGMQEQKETAREGRTEGREEARFERGKAWDVEKMGMQETRDIAKEERGEKRQAFGPLQIAGNDSPLEPGTVYQTNARGKIELVEKPKGTPSEMREFELTNYGKEVPELRGTPEYIEKRIEAKKKFQLSVNAPTDEEAESIAESIANGNMALKQIPKRGALFQKAQKAVTDKYPNFNFQLADANFNYRNNSGNLRSLGLVAAAMPRVYDLYHKSMDLQNSTDIPLLDEPLNKIKRALGSKKVADFESLRNAIILEVNTALSGSAVATDYRVKLELENLKSGMTLGQQMASIGNLISALEARMDASQLNPYPIEVVQGNKKMEDWKKEQEEQSKAVRQMIFNKANAGGGGGAAPIPGKPMGGGKTAYSGMSNDEILKALRD